MGAIFRDVVSVAASGIAAATMQLCEYIYIYIYMYFLFASCERYVCQRRSNGTPVGLEP